MINEQDRKEIKDRVVQSFANIDELTELVGKDDPSILQLYQDLEWVLMTLGIGGIK